MVSVPRLLAKIAGIMNRIKMYPMLPSFKVNKVQVQNYASII